MTPGPVSDLVPAGLDALSYEPLTPLAFLDRSALVFADRVALVDGPLVFTYAQLLDRCTRLAGAWHERAAEQPVAVLATNSHVALESHYSVPLAGLPLVALNYRLTPEDLGWIVGHAGCGLLVYEAATAEAAVRVAELVPGLRLVAADDGEYEELAASAPPYRADLEDERSLLSINYTSGTTGLPKGVMYHHRGAHLQALAMVVAARLSPESRFLWTLPMFHCNGWCFTWAVTAAGGTHVCLRAVDPALVWEQLRTSSITHFNAAPTVLSSLAWHAAAEPLSGPPVRVATGGAPPSPALLARLGQLGMDVMHVYGLTETYGPAMLCEWWPEWDELDEERRAVLRARQGVGNVVACSARVLDADGRDVPADGGTQGEIALRGNNVMLGYFKDDEATRRAAPDGWFRTGDVGVLHPDGYVELRDRSKDVIISGGENIASVEVEQAVMSHPAVLEVAVIGVPDDRWGEAPAAYVVLKDGATTSEEEIVDHVRGRLAHFKAPRHVVFGPLPKTATGKIQKFKLREEAWAGRDRRIG
ncbi:MAG TPA: AMP-binding protein [Acidimicrobiales bacterium]|nr:AMP-binding protein [Acidimicrobiales bacterium]